MPKRKSSSSSSSASPQTASATKSKRPSTRSSTAAAKLKAKEEVDEHVEESPTAVGAAHEKAAERHSNKAQSRPAPPANHSHNNKVKENDGNDQSTSLPPVLSLSSLPFKNKQHSRIQGQSKRTAFKNLKQILKAENYSSRPNNTPNYSNIQAPPSLIPAKKYCDITGFVAPYTDPKTGLRYSSSDVYQYIQTLPHDYVQRVLALRNAAVKLR